MPAVHLTPEIAAPATLSPWQCAHMPPELPLAGIGSRRHSAESATATTEPEYTQAPAHSIGTAAGEHKQAQQHALVHSHRAGIADAGDKQADASAPAPQPSTGLLADMQRHVVPDGRRTLVFYSRRCTSTSSSADLAGTPEARRSIVQSIAHAERVQPCYAGARARDCALMAARVLAGYQERAVSASEYCALLAIFSKHHGTQTRIFRYRHLTAVHADGMSKADKERLECVLLARFDWRLPYFLGPGCLALLMLAAVYGNALPLAARRAHERHADALFQHAEALMCSLPHASLGVVELAFHVLRRRMRGCRRWERHAARIAREFGVETGALPWIEA